MRMGHPRKDRTRLQRYSPALNTERIEVPVLCSYGAHDVRVHSDDVQIFINRLRETNNQVTVVTFPDEGHRSRCQESIMHYHEAVERFLTEHLPLSSDKPTHWRTNMHRTLTLRTHIPQLLSSLGISFLCILAHFIRIPLPGTPVPIIIQPLWKFFSRYHAWPLVRTFKSAHILTRSAIDSVALIRRIYNALGSDKWVYVGSGMHKCSEQHACIRSTSYNNSMGYSHATDHNLYSSSWDARLTSVVSFCGYGGTIVDNTPGSRHVSLCYW